MKAEEAEGAEGAEEEKIYLLPLPPLLLRLSPHLPIS